MGGAVASTRTEARQQLQCTVYRRWGARGGWWAVAAGQYITGQASWCDPQTAPAPAAAAWPCLE